jgi:glycosyltransferase involved in cell wall biosynthesis
VDRGPRRHSRPIRLSVIIPTLNEAATLPALLEALRVQTRLPDEVIVADARSTDGTADVARALGARVVAGGRPGGGRYAGAATATGDVLFFLDADVLPGPEFVASLLDQFDRRQCDVGAGLLQPSSGRPFDRLIAWIFNAAMQALESRMPRGAGCCIVVRRTLHEAIGGFDESLALAEDHDYVARAATRGRFGVLGDARLVVSPRRLEMEGYLRTALKYAWCEWCVLTRRPIRELPFAYEFGHYGADRR